MRNPQLLIRTLVLCSLLCFGIYANGYLDGAGIANAQAVYSLRNSVIGAAGSPGQSINYSTNGTLGQSTPIGIGAESDVTLYAGFWGRYWIPTGVEENPPRYRTMLYQNFPNPFNPSTTIRYYLPADDRVALEIFDAAGRVMARLVDGEQPSGQYSIRWSGRDARGNLVPSGVYFYRLKVGKHSLTRKMILLR